MKSLESVPANTLFYECYILLEDHVRSSGFYLNWDHSWKTPSGYQHDCKTQFKPYAVWCIWPVLHVKYSTLIPCTSFKMLITAACMEKACHGKLHRALCLHNSSDEQDSLDSYPQQKFHFFLNFPALVVNDWGLTPCGPRAPSARAHTAKKSSGPAVNLDLWHPSYFLPPAEDIKVCLVIIEGGLHMSISWRKPLLYK